MWCAVERVSIANLGRAVSRVALGTWSMGGWMWGGADPAAARATIERAIELGIDIIDTAPVYGFGLSESLVGEVLAAHGCRDEVVIATKCGLVWDERHEPWRDSSPASIRREVEASLERLRTSWVDLYQVHWPDANTPIEETAATLEQLRAEGLVRAIGVCNHDIAQMERFREVAKLDTTQFRFNLFERDRGREVLAYADAHDIVTMAYSPLARGLFTGTMTEDREPTDEARRADMFHGEAYRRHLAAVRRLDGLARAAYGRRVIHLACRWLLDLGVDIVLWGARRPEQLDAVAGVWGFSLDDAARERIDAIIADQLGGSA